MRKKYGIRRWAAMLLSICVAGTALGGGVSGEVRAEELLLDGEAIEVLSPDASENPDGGAFSAEGDETGLLPEENGEQILDPMEAEPAGAENAESEEMAVTENGAEENLPGEAEPDPADGETESEQPMSEELTIVGWEEVEELSLEAQSPVYSGNCGLNGQNVTWKLENGVMTISGSGEISYYGHPDEEQPWVSVRDEVKEIVIENGITYIGYNAFADFHNLEKVTIPDSVTGINHTVFYDCYALKEVTLGKGLTYLGTNVFCYSGLTSITLPASLTDFDEYTFGYAEALTAIYVDPANPSYTSRDGVLYSKDGSTLVRCPIGRKGESYAVPEGVTKLAPLAFDMCKMKTVTIPDSVTEIGNSAFRECGNLTSLTFPKNLKTIPYWVCLYDKALTSVVLPDGLETIEWEAFWACDSLESVDIPSTVTSLGEGAFPTTTQVNFSPAADLEKQEDGSYIQVARVEVPVKELYSQAYEVLKLVNQERKKEGAKALVMDQSLLETAMKRAAETSLYWDHTRPNGGSCFTANSLMAGENIALGSTTAAGVMNQWMNSAGHRANILGTGYTSIGIGCVEVDGVTYWVQCFARTVSSEAPSSAYADGEKTVTVSVNTDKTYYQPKIGISSSSIAVGGTAVITAEWFNGWCTVELPVSSLEIESSNPEICEISGEKITGLSSGKTELLMYFPGYREGAVRKTLTVKNDTVKVTFNGNGGTLKTKNKTLTVGGKYGKLETPKRKGYTFSGWYTKTKGGTKITASTKVASKKAHVLYARWKKISLGMTAVKSASNVKGKKLKVTVKAVSGAKGYEYSCATNSKFTKGKKTKTSNGKSVTFTSLKKGKTYYVRVRAYQTDSAGKKVFGKYSSVKRVKISK